MAFRSRALLAALPLLLAAGLAVACGPYQLPADPPPCGPPASNARPPQPLDTPAAPQSCLPPQANPPLPPPAQCPMPSQPPPYVQTCPQVCHPWTLTVAGGKLHLQAHGARSVCEKLTILVDGVEPVSVTVKGEMICLSAGNESCKSACFLEATARKVSRIGHDGATLVLEGDAKLTYARGGKKVDVTTDLLSVDVSSGQVICELNAPQPTVPVTPCCAETGPRTGPPAPSVPGSPRPPVTSY